MLLCVLHAGTISLIYILSFLISILWNGETVAHLPFNSGFDKNIVSKKFIGNNFFYFCAQSSFFIYKKFLVDMIPTS